MKKRRVTSDRRVALHGIAVAALLVFTAMVAYSGSASAVPEWSTFDGGVDARIRSVVVDASGRIYVGGDFQTAGSVPASRVAMWDGSAWHSLGSGVDVGEFVSALALDAAGNLYAGGKFTSIGGVSATRIAKWNGSSWSALGAGLSAEPNALAVDSSGKLYAANNHAVTGTQATDKMAMWDPSTQTWSAFGGGSNYRPYAVVVDANGHPIFGGDFNRVFNTYGGSEIVANRIAQWTGSSSWSRFPNLDSPNGVNNRVYVLALDAAGNLYAGGNFTRANVDINGAGGISVGYIAKWDGSQWTTLGTGLNGSVRSIAFDSSGQAYVGGLFTTAGGAAANRIARWDPIAQSWSSVGSGMNAQVDALAFDSSGLIAVGDFTTAGGVTAGRIARWGEPPVLLADAATWIRHRQELPMPSTESCDDVEDSPYAWGTGLTGGWQRTWAPWPNSGAGGWACLRYLINTGGNRWITSGE